MRAFDASSTLRRLVGTRRDRHGDVFRRDSCGLGVLVHLQPCLWEFLACKSLSDSSMLFLGASSPSRAVNNTPFAIFILNRRNARHSPRLDGFLRAILLNEDDSWW